MYAVALGLFVYKVVIPVGLLAILVMGLGGLIGAASVLERLGALSPGIFDGTLYLAAALLTLSAALTLAVKGWNLLRGFSNEKPRPPLLLRWPAFLIAVALVIACELFVPSDLVRSRNPVLAGAFILTTVAWVVLCASYLAYALSRGGLTLSWRIARASPFAAGMLTLACLGSTGLAFAANSLAEGPRVRAPRLPAPRSAGLCDSSLECTRQFLLASANADDLATLSSSSVPTSGFHDCMESRFQDDALIAKARRIATQFIGPDEAQDVVHATLVKICLQPKDHLDFEPYFLTSVRNAALHEIRKLRTCPLDLEPPPQCIPRPDEAYDEQESWHALRQALCTLGEEDQRILRMRYFDGMSELQIAQALGLEYATTRKRIQRARDKLLVAFPQRCR